MAYLVKPLVNLRREIDLRWPDRDRRTDGWLALPSQRISYGHNPDSAGRVHAIDVDSDGINPDWIIRAINRKTSGLWYIIWNRRLWSNTYDWKPYDYTGPSPHTDHMHIEVYHDSRGHDFGGSWNIAPSGVPATPPPGSPEVDWQDADALPAIKSVSQWVTSAARAATDHGAAIGTLRS